MRSFLRGGVALLVVFACTVTVIDVRGRASDAARGKELLARVQLGATRLSADEWQATAKRTVGPETAESVQSSHRMIDTALDDLDRLPHGHDSERLREIEERFDAAVAEQLRMIASGDLRAAAEVDRTRTDPSHRALEQELGVLSGSFAHQADRARLLADLGSLVGLLVTVFALLVPMGAFLRDRRRAAELELRAAGDRRLRALVAEGSDLVAVLDPEGRVTWAAGRGGDAVGGSPEDLVALPLAGRFADGGEALARAVAAARATPGAPGVAEARSVTGATLAVVANDLSSNPDAAGVVVNLRDISDQKALERELHQTQRLESVGKLAGGIAHDFNNLLTAIRGYADLVALAVPDNEPAQQRVRGIVDASDRAAELTRQLLAFSRRQMLEPKVLDPVAVVEGVRGMLERLIPSDIVLVHEHDPRVGHVRADRAQLEQVLVNLVVNARDAMQDGGRVAIDVRDVDLDCSAAGVPAGRYVRLSVADTGIGMDEATKERAFEPFFTTKPAEHGTGLGLSTVFGTVRQSDGYVVLDSAPGEGTVASVYLPRVEVQAPADHRPAAPRAAARAGTETVLLVDDHALVRDAAAAILTANGYDVLEAEHGQEALDLLSQHDEDVDLVVTDLVMPGMGGIELARRLEADRPDLPILFISGYSDDHRVRAGQFGGRPFLQKPFSDAELTGAVRGALAAPTATRAVA